jgi:hypothetical protein
MSMLQPAACCSCFTSSAGITNLPRAAAAICCSVSVSVVPVIAADLLVGLLVGWMYLLLLLMPDFWARASPL